MGSWYYLWDNGDISFVSAQTKEDAYFLLDEIGSAKADRLKPMSDGFFLGLRLKPVKGENPFDWESDGSSESVYGVLNEIEEEAIKRRGQAIKEAKEKAKEEARKRKEKPKYDTKIHPFAKP